MRVKIKTWDEMMDMEGSNIDIDGDIKLPCGVCYSKIMEKVMPKDRVIETSIDDVGNMIWVGDRFYFYIEDDMIEEKLMTKITDINICCDSELDEDFLDEKDDYIQNLEFENKNMAEFLESLGYTQEQITSIALTGYVLTLE